MSSPEEKTKHSRRIKRKQKERQERVRSPIAKELITSGKFKMRVVKDKKNKEHDLEKMKFRDLVEAIEELDEE